MKKWAENFLMIILPVAECLEPVLYMSVLKECSLSNAVMFLVNGELNASLCSYWASQWASFTLTGVNDSAAIVKIDLATLWRATVLHPSHHIFYVTGMAAQESQSR